jgi:hypothetical protein
MSQRANSRLREIAVSVAVCLSLPSAAPAQERVQEGAQQARLRYEVHVTMFVLADLNVVTDSTWRCWRDGAKLRVELTAGALPVVSLRDGKGGEYLLIPNQRKAISFVKGPAAVSGQSGTVGLPNTLWNGMLQMADSLTGQMATSERVVGTEQIGRHKCQVVEQSREASQHSGGVGYRSKEWRATVAGIPLAVRRVSRVGDVVTVQSLLSLDESPDLPDDLFRVPPDFTAQQVPETSLAAMLDLMRALSPTGAPQR